MNDERLTRTPMVPDTEDVVEFFENFWTVTDLAEHLQVSDKTIYDWVHKRVIPFHKIHRLVRFKPSEIGKWLSSQGESHVDR